MVYGNKLYWETLHASDILTSSPSDVCKNCSVVDKSMKIGTNVLWQVLINFR